MLILTNLTISVKCNTIYFCITFIIVNFDDGDEDDCVEMLITIIMINVFDHKIFKYNPIKLLYFVKKKV